MQIQRSCMHVVSRGMMFAHVSSQIFQSWLPQHNNVTIVHLVVCIEIYHVHQPSAMALYDAIDDACGGLIVAMDRRWWLWVIDYFLGKAKKRLL